MLTNGSGHPAANGSDAGAPAKPPATTTLAGAMAKGATATAESERRRSVKAMSERMHQLISDQMDIDDAQERSLAEARRELGETRQRLADAEAKSARERAEAQALAASLRGDIQTLEAEAARLARELDEERKRTHDLDARMRQVAAIAASKTS